MEFTALGGVVNVAELVVAGAVLLEFCSEQWRLQRAHYIFEKGWLVFWLDVTVRLEAQA